MRSASGVSAGPANKAGLGMETVLGGRVQKGKEGPGELYLAV